LPPSMELGSGALEARLLGILQILKSNAKLCLRMRGRVGRLVKPKKELRRGCFMINDKTKEDVLPRSKKLGGRLRESVR